MSAPIDNKTGKLPWTLKDYCIIDANGDIVCHLSNRETGAFIISHIEIAVDIEKLLHHRSSTLYANTP